MNYKDIEKVRLMIKALLLEKGDHALYIIEGDEVYIDNEKLESLVDKIFPWKLLNYSLDEISVNELKRHIF